MSKTKIAWTDESWNPLRGTEGRWHCTKVSAGCKNCYAERLNVRFGGPKFQARADTTRLDEKILNYPLSWKKPRMVFVCSMTDLFHEDVSYDWIDKVFAVMAMAKQHTFQILTKRPARMHDYLKYDFDHILRIGYLAAKHAGIDETTSIKKTIEIAAKTKPAFPLKNVWVGVSAENQKAADERIPILFDTPAAVRWVSMEPLLGPVDLDSPDGCALHALGCGYGRDCPDKCPGLDWVVVGGESGLKARPMRVEWVESIRDQCKEAGTPFFFKQGSQKDWDNFRDFDSFREDLRIREFPKNEDNSQAL